MIPISGSPIVFASIGFFLIMGYISSIWECYTTLIFFLDIVKGKKKKDQWKSSEELSLQIPSQIELNWCWAIVLVRFCSFAISPTPDLLQRIELLDLANVWVGGEWSMVSEHFGSSLYSTSARPRNSSPWECARLRVFSLLTQSISSTAAFLAILGVGCRLTWFVFVIGVFSGPSLSHQLILLAKNLSWFLLDSAKSPRVSQACSSTYSYVDQTLLPEYGNATALYSLMSL